MVKCGPNVISAVKKSLEETGDIPDQPKLGRPTKITPEVKSFIIQQTISNPFTSGRDLSHQIQISSNLNIQSLGRSTINSIRHVSRFRYLPPVKEPSLTEMQIQKRMNFCYSFLLRRNEFPNIGFRKKVALAPKRCKESKSN